MVAPITEEDKPFIESMIKRLKRMRKREVATKKCPDTNLDDAIDHLMEYGCNKGWWEYNRN